MVSLDISYVIIFHAILFQMEKYYYLRMHIIKKPTVMIMDEATSGLDNESQARIQDLSNPTGKVKVC